MDLEIKINAREIEKGLLSRAKQIPFASSLALNRIGYAVKDHINKEVLPKIFDRPDPWTTKALYFKKSTKHTLEASLAYRSWALKGTPSSEIMYHHVYGGQRPIKRSEKLLRGFGVMGNDKWLVPAPGARLDQYGNVLKKDIVAMLSAVGATLDSAQRSKKSKKKKRFIVTKGAIYMRRNDYGRGVRPLPMFFITEAPTYKPIFPIYQIIDRKVSEIAPKIIEKAIWEVILTEKK